jgi:hypothetical protein
LGVSLWQPHRRDEHLGRRTHAWLRSHAAKGENAFGRAFFLNSRQERTFGGAGSGQKKKTPIPYLIRDRGRIVPEVGLEPTHLSILHFECSASTIPPLGRAQFEAARISVTDNCYVLKSSRPCGYPLYMQIGLTTKPSIDDVPGHAGIEGAR